MTAYLPFSFLETMDIRDTGFFYTKWEILLLGVYAVLIGILLFRIWDFSLQTLIVIILNTVLGFMHQHATNNKKCVKICIQMLLNVIIKYIYINSEFQKV